jgi:hypothetical protein
MTVNQNQQPPRRPSTAAGLAELQHEVRMLAAHVQVQTAMLAHQGLIPPGEPGLPAERLAHEPPEGYPPTPRQIRLARRHGMHAVRAGGAR